MLFNGLLAIASFMTLLSVLTGTLISVVKMTEAIQQHKPVNSPRPFPWNQPRC